MSVATIRTSALSGGMARARILMLPTVSSATRRSIASVPPSPAVTARSSSGDKHATARTLDAASSTTMLASSAPPAARATAGRPAPDSTASETASKALRKALGAADDAGCWAADTRKL